MESTIVVVIDVCEALMGKQLHVEVGNGKYNHFDCSLSEKKKIGRELHILVLSRTQQEDKMASYSISTRL